MQSHHSAMTPHHSAIHIYDSAWNGLLNSLCIIQPATRVKFDHYWTFCFCGRIIDQCPIRTGQGRAGLSKQRLQMRIYSSSWSTEIYRLLTLPCMELFQPCSLENSSLLRIPCSLCIIRTRSVEGWWTVFNDVIAFVGQRRQAGRGGMRRACVRTTRPWSVVRTRSDHFAENPALVWGRPTCIKHRSCTYNPRRRVPWNLSNKNLFIAADADINAWHWAGIDFPYIFVPFVRLDYYTL